MKSKELLQSEEYWTARMQNLLYAAVEDHLADHNKTKKDFAKEIGVSKGYVTQVLNGNADHRISTFVKFALASGMVPDLKLVSLETYLQHRLSEHVAIDSLIRISEHPINSTQTLNLSDILRSRRVQPNTVIVEDKHP